MSNNNNGSIYYNSNEKEWYRNPTKEEELQARKAFVEKVISEKKIQGNEILKKYGFKKGVKVYYHPQMEKENTRYPATITEADWNRITIEFDTEDITKTPQYNKKMYIITITADAYLTKINEGGKRKAKKTRKARKAKKGTYRRRR